MSTKARGFGLTAELEKKKAGKFDADRANETLEWLKAVLEYADAADPDIATVVEVSTMADVAKVLKDGRVLCKVMNILYPGTIKKINKIDNPNSPFKKTKEEENINQFLGGCEKMAGCARSDLFEIVDLYECDNIPTVIDGLFSLGRKMHGHANQDIPALGPNECASQAGQNFGKTRAIID